MPREVGLVGESNGGVVFHGQGRAMLESLGPTNNKLGVAYISFTTKFPPSALDRPDNPIQFRASMTYK